MGSPVSSAASQRPLVLIVDDEPQIRELLTEVITGADLDAITAADGFTGLDRARLHKPDLILLDFMMPGLSGTQVAQELRYTSTNATTPIIMLTARTTKTSRAMGLACGADLYLTKPFKVGELLGHVQSLLTEPVR